MHHIAVLEDDARRLSVMRKVAVTALMDCEFTWFDDANEMVKWLAENPGGYDLLSLDCDLDATIAAGEDCGTGEDVTAFLAKQVSSCAVIIHSSNALRAPAMHLQLALAGFQKLWLCPFRDGAQWTTDIQRALQKERKSKV